jgi:hypothetical protein
MPRFVVQQHFRSEDDWHFDLMLEAAGALVTFSSHTPPEAREALPCTVRHLGDHRLAYLEYEGQISGGRGWCRIHDRGSLEWIEPTDPSLLPSADEIRIRLAGEKADGTFQLVREPASGTDYWRLKKCLSP